MTRHDHFHRMVGSPLGLSGLGGALLSGALALGLTGCKTVESKPQPNQTSMMPTLDGSPENPFAGKTDFTREMSADQKFNVHLELGRVYESKQSLEAALVEYQKAADLAEKKGGLLTSNSFGPDKRALVQRRMGGANDRMGRFTQAEIHYRKALEHAPTDAKVWNDIGYSYYLQNRLLDAENALKTAQSMDPNNPKILTNMGLTLAAAGKQDEALQALSRAGGPAVGHANLGFILAAMGKMDEARAQYQLALELQPQLTAARDAIAKLDAPPVLNAPTALVASAAPRPAGVPTSPPASAPTPPPIVSQVKPAGAGPEAKSDSVTRTAAPEPAAPQPPAPVEVPPAPPTSPPAAPDTAAANVLRSLPELPPTLAKDAQVQAASAVVELPIVEETPGRPRYDASVHKAAGQPAQFGRNRQPPSGQQGGQGVRARGVEPLEESPEPDPCLAVVIAGSPERQQPVG
ncbi:MAG: tetratricopeptide repeat protein [Isosphaeraceae bacterium]